MTFQPNKQKSIKEYNELYQEWYDPQRKSLRVRTRLNGSADINDAIDMVSVLLERYQSLFKIANTEEWTLFFGNMFITPKEGDQVYNKTKDEVYTITHILKDRYNNKWTGWVRVSGSVAPASTDKLEFVDKETKYVKFRIGYPLKAAKKITEANGELGDKESDPWIPTITVRLVRREPSSFGASQPFERRQSLKPKLMEVFKDENDEKRYSIEVWDQMFDNLLQFDCWDLDSRISLLLGNWFERFMVATFGVLKYNGVQEMFFWERTDMEPTNRWRDDITAQSIKYYFRTSEKKVVKRRNLTWLNVELRVVKDEAFLDSGGSGETAFERLHNDSGELIVGTLQIADSLWQDKEDLPPVHSLFWGDL